MTPEQFKQLMSAVITIKADVFIVMVILSAMLGFHLAEYTWRKLR